MNWDNIDLTAPQGWVCPKCGRVYSPTTPMCYYCGGEQTSTVSTGTGTGTPYIDYVHSVAQTEKRTSDDEI